MHAYVIHFGREQRGNIYCASLFCMFFVISKSSVINILKGICNEIPHQLYTKNKF